MKKEIIFIDEDTLTPEELEQINELNSGDPDETKWLKSNLKDEGKFVEGGDADGKADE